MSMGSSAVKAIVGIVIGVALISAGGLLMAAASGGDAMLLLMTGGIVAAVAGVAVAGASLRRLFGGDRSQKCPSCMDPVVPGAVTCPNCGHAYAS
jgi:hypothetical protein